MRKTSRHPQRSLTRIQFFIYAPYHRVCVGIVQRTDRGWMCYAETLRGQMFFAGESDGDGIQPTPSAAMEHLLHKLDRAWGWKWNGRVYLGDMPVDERMRAIPEPRP